MELSIVIHPADYTAFLNYYLFRIRFKSRILLYLLLSLIVTTVLTWRDGNLPLNQKILLFALTPVCAILVGFSFLYFFTKLSGRIYLSKKGVVLGPRKYVLSEDRFSQESEKAQSSVIWSSVLSLKESSSYYFLFVDKAAAFIIPKRHFATKADEDKFISFIRSKLTN
ncbi:MAG: YcxB family protein [Flavobacteriales bacterium]